MPRSPLFVATLASLGMGLGLMIPFEAPVARIAGVASLFAFIVCGVFLIANPTDLRGSGPDRE